MNLNKSDYRTLNLFFQERGTKRLDLQTRDLKFLEAMYDMRYVTVPHLTCLYPTVEATTINPNSQFRGGQEAIRKRLIKLKQHGYVDQLSYQLRRPNEPAIYILSQEGARALADYADYSYNQVMAQVRYVRKYLIDKRNQNKNYFINHRLGINAFRVALYAALKNHETADFERDDNKQPKWMEPTLRDRKLDLKISVTCDLEDIPKFVRPALRLGETKTKISRAPDALFILNLNGHKIGCLYEKDKGTEKHSVIAAKLFCYHQWYKRKGHEKLFGTPHLRVLLETESDLRVRNMIDKAALKVRQVKNKQTGELVPTGSGIFWFTATENISLEKPASILQDIWTVGHVNHLTEQHSLLDI